MSSFEGFSCKFMNLVLVGEGNRSIGVVPKLVKGVVSVEGIQINGKRVVQRTDSHNSFTALESKF